MNIVARLMLIFCSTSLLLCTPGLQATGGGSEGEARSASVAGQVFYQTDGMPASGAQIIIRLSTFLADTSAAPKPVVINGVTDADGRFRVDSVDTGRYSLEINDRRGNAVLLHASVAAKDAQVLIGTDSLRPTATLRGSVVLAAQTKLTSSHVLVYGLERAARPDSTGEFVLSDMPAGTYTMRIAPDTSTGCQARDTAGVSVPAGAIRDIAPIILYSFSSEPYSSWRFADTIMINTTASGAGVPVTQTGVPLLVRFDSSSRVFSRPGIAANGEDIRFTKSNGVHVPYQIERWDPALKRAEIWLALDTVQGNDSTGFIVMYSGKDGVSSWSDGSSVFDPEKGFAAVWHCGTSMNDATGNGNNGTGTGVASEEGAIGQAWVFNGSSTIIIDSSTSLNMANKSVSILLWQQSSQAYASERMFFEHEIWPDIGDFGFSTVNDRGLSFDFPTANSEVRSHDSLVNDNRWHMEAVSFNDAIDTGVIFHDGRAVKADTVRSSISSGTGRSYLGSRGGTERFFVGTMDEVWILSRPLSADYIRLLYENQRPDQTMIRWR
jgi:hypothetical protein